jgi:hypothetical protein
MYCQACAHFTKQCSAECNEIVGAVVIKLTVHPLQFTGSSDTENFAFAVPKHILQIIGHDTVCT